MLVGIIPDIDEPEHFNFVRLPSCPIELGNMPLIFGSQVKLTTDSSLTEQET